MKSQIDPAHNDFSSLLQGSGRRVEEEEAAGGTSLAKLGHEVSEFPSSYSVKSAA